MSLNDLIERTAELQEQINSWRPFTDPDLLAEIREFHRIPVIFSSNSIEGSTYTEGETKILIEYGIVPPDKPVHDAGMTMGLNNTYDFMFDLVHERGIEVSDAINMHRLLAGGLDNEAVPGEFRKDPIYVVGATHRFPKADKILGMIEKTFNSINKMNAHPVLKAARAHAEFVWIHPFKDGNGRVARMLMNTILVQSGYLPVIVPPILKRDYNFLLDNYRKNPQEFAGFVLEHEINSQKDFIRAIGPKLDNMTGPRL